MKSSKKTNKKIQKAIDDIFSFTDEKDQIEIDAKVLMAKFLSEVQEIADKKGLKRNQLAKMIGTSASYITQLYRGHKLMNLITAAKFQKALDIQFNISLLEENKSANPINEKNIGEQLDRWYCDNETDESVMITRNFAKSKKNNEFNNHTLIVCSDMLGRITSNN